MDDIDECKDIVHNVFLNLWNNWEEIDTSKSLKSYLFRSVHNRCLNYIRDNKKIIHHDLPEDISSLDAYIDSVDYLEQSELEMKIKKAIENLPDKCKSIFIMNRFDEKKYTEIAQMLNVSVKAVEAQMTKALKILREQLADYLPALLLLFIQL